MGIQVRAEFQMRSDAVALYVTEQESKRLLVATTFGMKEHTPGEYINPTTHINFTAAQELMDDLWRCGLRPSAGKGTAGALSATQKHLEDMQKITFGLLGKHFK